MFSNKTKLGTLIVGSLFYMNNVSAALVTINWQEIGGYNVFERQAVTFEPIIVNNFIGFSSGGHWENLVDTENSLISAKIYLKLNDEWVLFAEDNTVRGTFGSTATLDSFTYLPLNFSAGLLGGINITNTGAGASLYSAMNSSKTGTNFYFNATTVPITGSLTLLISGCLTMLIPYARRKSIT